MSQYIQKLPGGTHCTATLPCTEHLLPAKNLPSPSPIMCLKNANCASVHMEHGSCPSLLDQGMNHPWLRKRGDSFDSKTAGI
jgi:hypothetical protein